MPERFATDIATAAGAFTAPWWLQFVSYGYHGMMAAGAAALLMLRLLIAWREWRQRRSERASKAK